MMKIAVKGALALFLTIGATSELRAQVAIGDDWGSAGARIGYFAPISTFEDRQFGGENSFGNAFAIGATASVWPMFDHRVGFRAEIVRSATDGKNSQTEFAPIALNDPVQWLYSLELLARQPMGTIAPYVGVGAGFKQYNWAVSLHDEDRSFLWSVAGGLEVRPGVGPFGLTVDLRSYQSKFQGFGVNDGDWSPGGPDNIARPTPEGMTDIGFFGGETGGLSNMDLMLSTSISYTF
ncbi:MAG: hypothetical protein WD737_05475 [Gemmatimonadota bacterium]